MPQATAPVTGSRMNLRNETAPRQFGPPFATPPMDITEALRQLQIFSHQLNTHEHETGPPPLPTQAPPLPNHAPSASHRPPPSVNLTSSLPTEIPSEHIEPSSDSVDKHPLFYFEDGNMAFKVRLQILCGDVIGGSLNTFSRTRSLPSTTAFIDPS